MYLRYIVTFASLCAFLYIPSIYLLQIFVWFRDKNHTVEVCWNVMAHSQKPDFVFRAKRTIPFKSAGGRQFSRLLAAEVCVSAVVMLDTPCSEVVWRVLATHCNRQFPLHFPSLRLRVPLHFISTIPDENWNWFLSKNWVMREIFQRIFATSMYTSLWILCLLDRASSW